MAILGIWDITRRTLAKIHSQQKVATPPLAAFALATEPPGAIHPTHDHAWPPATPQVAMHGAQAAQTAQLGAIDSRACL